MVKNRNLADFSKYVSLNVIGMLAVNCYILADTFFISNEIGLNALTSLNLALPVFGVIFGVGMMLGMGGATKYALLKAEGLDADRTLTHSLLLGLIFSVFFELAAVFLSVPLSRLLGASDTTIALTSEYISTLLYFAPAFIAQQIFTCFVRNDGSPAIAMISMAVGSVSNVLMDYVFIYPLGMGMFGAVIATGIAPLISLCILSTHWIFKCNKLKFKFVKPQLKLFGNIFALGVFSFISEISNGIVVFVFNFLILGLAGEIGVAAYGVIVNVFYVAIGFFNGVAQGVQPLISKRYGEGNYNDVKKLLLYAMVTAFSIAAAIYIFAVAMPDQIVSVFNSENSAEMASIAVQGMRLFFIGVFFVGFNVINAGFFSAVEKGGRAFAISVLRGLIVLIAMAFLLSHFFGMTGVWLALPSSEVIVCIVGAILLSNCLKNLKGGDFEIEKKFI